jgi:DNA-binding GntR family transcriptional regulator
VAAVQAGGDGLSDGSVLESSVSRLARQTLADRVYADVKELFLSGQIPPGERLTLRRLAAAVGTSPMPVRDAVSRLVSDKALELLPNRSVQVSWPSRSRFEEIVLIRCNLEGLAAELAATRRTDAELSTIRAHAQMFERCVDPADPKPLEAIRANRLMHYGIYFAARMPTLQQMIEGLWLQVGPVFAATVIESLKAGGAWHPARPSPASQDETSRHDPLLTGTNRWHTALVEAIAAQDGTAARDAVVADIAEAAEMIIASGRLSQEHEAEPAPVS